jgi:hypothetical protein
MLGIMRDPVLACGLSKTDKSARTGAEGSSRVLRSAADALDFSAIAPRAHLRLRLGVAVATAAVAQAVLVSAASGDAISSITGSSCPPVASSQVFLPWLDAAFYELAPNGGFETGAKSWSLSGDAQVTAGNESYFAHSSSDHKSLKLPDGSSALSSPVCIGLTRPAFRVFTSNSGAATSSLHVQVIYRGLLGMLSVLDGGTIVAGSAWTPTPRLLMPEVPLGSTSVQLKFTPVGSGGNWRIDDLYNDPFNSV